MTTVIVTIAVGSLVGGLGYAVGPIRRWVDANMRGWVLVLAILNMLLASAIILLWP